MRLRNGMVGALTTLFLAITGGCLIAGDAEAVVNVYFSTSAPTALQKEFIASTTNQYLGVVVPGAFTNFFTMTLSGKNSAYVPPTPPAASTTVVTLDGLIKGLVAVSTYSYVPGWRDGAQWERLDNLASLSGFQMYCSSATAWNLPDILFSSHTCQNVLYTMYGHILQKDYAEPQPLPLPPGY